MTANDPDGSIASWELDVDNDGTPEYSDTGDPPETQSHTYDDPGTFTAELTVWDDDGTPAYATTGVTVNELPNQPPTCDLTATPSSGDAPLTTTFSMSASDPDGDITSWELDVDNDGTPEYSGAGDLPATQQHTYTAAGEYTAELIAWDDEGATGIDTTIVNVYWVPPSVTIIAPNGGETLYAGTNYDITWSTTPGSGTITVVDLEYSTDAGAIYEIIVTGTPDDGSYTWTIPNDSGTQCLVRGIVHDDNSEIGSDISDAYFEIVGVPPGAPSNLVVQHYGAMSVQDVADSFSKAYSEPTTNDYAATHTSDDIMHIISEDDRVQGGSGKATLDITYNILISSGTVAPYTLHIESYEVDNDDSYTVSYTVNGVGGESSIITIPSTESVLSYQISGVSAGDTVNINIKDSKLKPGENVGTVSIDHLYIGSGGGGTDDNKLTWDASSDDKTGADNVAVYNVYRSIVNGEPWNYAGQVTADDSAAYSYMDSGKGSADSTQWWYMVRAEDTEGLESSNSNSAQEPGTQNNPPNTPSYLNPADAVTGVSIVTDLSWTGGDPDSGDAVEYDVYFGTSPTPPLVTTVTSEFYDPGTLAYLTTYYWQIVARDNHGANTAGSIWSFTTETEPVGLTVDSITPDNMQLGTTISVTIYGSGFKDNAAVTFENGDGPNPKASNIVVVDSNTITCDVYAKDGGPPRPRLWDVRVTNIDSSTGVLEDGFTVNP
jgi:PKD repeat protein